MMNKKLISIACIAFTLSMFSTSSAAANLTPNENAFKIFGHTLEAVHASEKHIITLTPKNSKKVNFITLINEGIFHKRYHQCSDTESKKCVICKVSSSLPSPLTLDTTGILSTEPKELILRFSTPDSLVSTITLTPDNISNPILAGRFYGSLTELPQVLAFVGFSKVVIQFNPDVIAELLSKK